MVGRSIARSTRWGTLVGPGIWRKCRPGCLIGVRGSRFTVRSSRLGVWVMGYSGVLAVCRGGSDGTHGAYGLRVDVVTHSRWVRAGKWWRRSAGQSQAPGGTNCKPQTANCQPAILARNRRMGSSESVVGVLVGNHGVDCG